MANERTIYHNENIYDTNYPKTGYPISDSRRAEYSGGLWTVRANNAMRVLRALFNYAMYEYQDGNGLPIITINPNG